MNSGKTSLTGSAEIKIKIVSIDFHQNWIPNKSKCEVLTFFKILGFEPIGLFVF